MAKRKVNVYEKKIPIAPNGQPYDPGDIDYYVNALGYSYQGAIERLSESYKYNTANRKEYYAIESE